MRKYIGLGLVLTAVFVGGFWTHAQVQAPNPPRVLPSPPLTPGQQVQNIISGADVGFRVERWDGDTPVGRWVVRKDGQWVETRTSVGARRLAH